MNHLFISADKIHDGFSWLPDGSVLELSSMGETLQIHDHAVIPEEKIQHYEGIICPGFVNAHTHLELSHLKGQIPEATGLVDFVRAVVGIRNDFSKDQKLAAIAQSIGEIKNNGIVAVGDIANTADLQSFRENSELHFHTFVEVLGFDPADAGKAFEAAFSVLLRYESGVGSSYLLHQSLVPHAPYSVSEVLFDMINDFEENQIVSIHNQETEAENQWFLTKEGNFPEFFKVLNFSSEHFRPSGKSSLQTYIPWLSKVGQLLLVHNTCTNREDLVFARRQNQQIFYCLCPVANWYIERKVPPVKDLMDAGVPICLGTDSLASNHELNILAEIHQLKKHFPELSMEDLLRWATSNGAKALRMEEVVGSFTPGKMPGVLYIKNNATHPEVLFPAGMPGHPACSG